MSNPSKKQALDAELRAWRRLSDHLEVCRQRHLPRRAEDTDPLPGVPCRDCAECDRLYAAHARAIDSLHVEAAAAKVGPLWNPAGLFL